MQMEETIPNYFKKNWITFEFEAILPFVESTIMKDEDEECKLH